VSPLFENRVNRQWLPATFAETGGIIGAHVGEIAATGTRIHPPVGIVELHGAEGLDIDSPDDWMVAESFLGRRRIVIRADAGPSLGMGHAYRAIALANELLGHTVTIVTRDGPGTELGPSFFSRKGFPARCIRDDAEFLELLDSLGADITFLDVLDTSREFVSAVRERTGFVVSLEDLGEGGLEADLLVNDLYSSQAHADNRWYGVAVSLLSPQFETVAPREDVSDSVERVVISFGGTDPNDLTRLALEALKLARFAGRVTVVLGPGRWQDELDLSGTGLTAEVVRDVAHMALLMRDADIAITSGGRTVTELMTLGIPTIVLCQNQRELWHTHASPQLGVLNLGLGAHAAPDTIAGHFRKLTEDRALRAEMRRRALEAIKGRSNRAIVSRILAAAARTG
jgi:spore coat polysaccharide biosynthesis predicted glycosyltransferase SpsG